MKPIRPIKIAILSTIHGHAPSYFNILNNPMFELVGASVVEGSENVLRAYIYEMGVPLYNSDEELYAAHPDLEAVVVGSENKNHAKQTIDAANRGLHIISMKVPSLDMDEYRDMIDAVEKNNVVCMVELELRRYPGPYRADELIKSGAIGELESINIINYSHNPVWWCPWQCDPELSYGKAMPLRPGDNRFRGGALTDHAHPFDLVRMMSGSDFDTVYANVTPNLREGIVTEDMIRLIGRMKNGVNFSIDPSYANNEHHVKKLEGVYDWRKYPKIVEVFMTAVGSKGTIVTDLFNKNTYLQIGKDGEYQAAFSHYGMQHIWTPDVLTFYNAVREGSKDYIGLREHMNSMEAVVAAYDSVYSGKPVKLP